MWHSSTTGLCSMEEGLPQLPGKFLLLLASDHMN
ncbi:hypothetical protein LINPERPRIM_LOCUS23083 [Linum perenne]